MTTTTRHDAYLREIPYGGPGYSEPGQNAFYDENSGEPWTMYVVPTCRTCMWDGPRYYVGARLHVGEEQMAWAKATEMLDAHVCGRPLRKDQQGPPHGRFYL